MRKHLKDTNKLNITHKVWIYKNINLLLRHEIDKKW